VYTTDKHDNPFDDAFSLLENFAKTEKSKVQKIKTCSDFDFNDQM
jgi:hypothetical protein